MILTPATEADYPLIVALANLAYRGTGANSSWTHETGVIEGQRLSDASLRADLAAKPQAHLLLYRDEPHAALLGTVWLEPTPDAVWYLGLLTVHPEAQNRQLGRTLLAAAEQFAKTHAARTIRMTVLNVRHQLIAWYERRGYNQTGETQPFPYGDDRVGKPLRDDLCFIVLAKDL